VYSRSAYYIKKYAAKLTTYIIADRFLPVKMNSTKNYFIYLPHLALPLAASYGLMPRAQEEKKKATETATTNNNTIRLIITQVFTSKRG
jgi:hypothetical protein